MANIIGVQFQKNGKCYDFDTQILQPAVGQFVIVDTSRGIDLAEVVTAVHEVPDEQISEPLKKVIRIATQQDLQRAADNRVREKEARTICQKKIQEHKLEMKLVSVEYLYDNSKLLFYFTANGRVDFRSLVKDLASVFKTRIELRQIGVRDEARMLGGLGPCGRPICCGAFLSDFQPVSIKMAKEQNLSLNPTKISGVCGRLMCCLKYEQDHYEEMRKRMPRVGREVATPDGTGTVTELNVVKETVSVRIMNGDTGEIKEYPLDVLTWKQRGAAGQQSDAFENGQEVPDQDQRSETGIVGDASPERDSSAQRPDMNRQGRNSSQQEHKAERKDRKSAGPKVDKQGRKSERNASRKQLGQPVRRENNRKASESARQNARTMEQPEATMNEQNEHASYMGAESSWVSQVQQAMKALDHHEQ